MTESYRKSLLPNGIRVITERMPHVRSVAVGIWVETGSRHEATGRPAAPGRSSTRCTLTKPVVSDWPKPVQNFAPVSLWRRSMVGGASSPET